MADESEYKKKELGKESKAKIALIAILRLETIENLVKRYNERYRISKGKIRQWKKELLNILFPEKVVEPQEPHEPEAPSAEKSNREVIEKLIVALSNIDTTLLKFDKTQRRSNWILLAYVLATISMATFTYKMARSTQEMSELKKKAKLEINFVMEAPFETTAKEDKGILFSIQDFLYNQDDINFYIEAANKCEFGIEDEITIIYKAKFCNIQNEEWGSDYEEEIFENIRLEPKEKKKFPAKLIKRLLLDEDKLNLEKDKENIDKFVKIEIEVSGNSVLKFPFGIIDIKYNIHKIQKK